MSTISVPAPKHSKKNAILMAGSAALVLMAALGLGTWQVLEREDGAATAGTTPGQVERVAVPPPSAAATADERLTVFIVGSEQQAAALRQSLEYVTDPAGAAIPTASRKIEVVIAGTAEDAAGVQRGLDEMDNQRQSLGLPGVERVDLRPPAAGPAGDGEVPSSEDPR